ncbi:MAG TPA: hypothetical protein VHD85_07875 [Terracidiphilus sp.]|nr:hypothetical protein [Terracidiphilus sp.]
MPTHNEHLPEGHKNEEIDASLGFEQTDVRITGILVFLVAMLIFVAVTGATCWGIGKMLNAHLNKEDGPNNKWTKTVDVRQLGNMPSSPELQNKIAEITQTFPMPRVQLDDGNQDVAVLHAREDILLNNYTWVDQSKGKVRIPIERAMEIIAQHGLPVAPAAQTQPLMAGDSRPTVTMPLTNGFARTTYEQDEAAAHLQRNSEAAAK